MKGKINYLSEIIKQLLKIVQSINNLTRYSSFFLKRKGLAPRGTECACGNASLTSVSHGRLSWP